jgi:hypothetical protein
VQSILDRPGSSILAAIDLGCFDKPAAIGRNRSERRLGEKKFVLFDNSTDSYKRCRRSFGMESRNSLEVSNHENDDEGFRNSGGRLCRVDDDGASGAGTAGAVRRPPGFMDRIGQYRAFGRITGTAEVPSDVPGR